MFSLLASLAGVSAPAAATRAQAPALSQALAPTQAAGAQVSAQAYVQARAPEQAPAPAQASASASAAGAAQEALIRARALGPGLAKANNCIACHTVERQRVGPAFKAIAQRFAGNEAAVDALAYSIRHGGGGRWGPIPMPAQPQVTEDSARTLAQWILSLASNTPAK
ncbi:MAG: c-type cytochrome [Burkholderiaceae bacterium]|nr:MAG: c-type cytochrome [Burkholderiaceae bacterium]TAM05929.1 MAG: c-type cytochrome [Pusillimonas sp.]